MEDTKKLKTHFCEYCNFETRNKTDYAPHILPSKHTKKQKDTTMIQKKRTIQQTIVLAAIVVRFPNTIQDFGGIRTNANY